jgi:hypothetical protein
MSLPMRNMLRPRSKNAALFALAPGDQICTYRVQADGYHGHDSREFRGAAPPATRHGVVLATNCQHTPGSTYSAAFCRPLCVHQHVDTLNAILKPRSSPLWNLAFFSPVSTCRLLCAAYDRVAGRSSSNSSNPE